ncbi:MAG TPA: aldolase/citrate lyase family protein [Bacillus sp. (in: firmicutes)]|nr:aldolase/citrate lyase family protein [Bacillus sp. (in: firmicutes)]
MKSDFKRKLSLQPCIGTFLKLPRPEVVEILSLAGFDFVICDMEHAQISEIEARDVIRTAVALDLPVIVRLPDPTQGLVNRLLEVGVTGIQIPRLNSIQDIKHLYSVTHFPPAGTRSVGRANLASKYGRVTLKDYLESENSRVLTIGQFETKEMEQPSELLFEGLDVAFIGPTDLGVDFGVPGNINDERVQNRIKAVEKLAAATNTFMGAFTNNLSSAKQYIDKGYRFIAISGDISFLQKGANALLKDLQNLIVTGEK